MIAARIVAEGHTTKFWVNGEFAHRQRLVR